MSGLVALIGIASLGGVLAGGVLLRPASAAAASAAVDVQVDAACVKGCVTDLRSCTTDARKAFVDCSIQDGCVELAAQARTACMADHNSSVCLEARVAYSDCMRPCRSQLRSDLRTCKNNALTCLHDTCGLTDLPAKCGPASVSIAAAK